MHNESIRDRDIIIVVFRNISFEFTKSNMKKKIHCESVSSTV